MNFGKKNDFLFIIKSRNKFSLVMRGLFFSFDSLDAVHSNIV